MFTGFVYDLVISYNFHVVTRPLWPRLQVSVTCLDFGVEAETRTVWSGFKDAVSVCFHTWHPEAKMCVREDPVSTLL